MEPTKTSPTWLEDANGNRCSVERWKPIKGFSGHYEVSTLGRVRSLDRLNVNRCGVSRVLKGQLLSLSRDGEGYLQVGLLRYGIETKARVHRLVAEAFVANPSGLPLVDHRDRDRRNNASENLRWATHSENRRNTSRRSNADAMADMKRLAEEEATGAAS